MATRQQRAPEAREEPSRVRPVQEVGKRASAINLRKPAAKAAKAGEEEEEE